MNTLLAPQRHPVDDRPGRVPDTLQLPSHHTRIALVDRLVLRVGLRLLLWSTRTPRMTDDRLRHSHGFRHQETIALRERGHLREALLLAPRA
jgi:hypothetical protein